MLNFSKIKIFSIYFIFLLFCFFTFLNFQSKDRTILDKKVNLGLDLQGGSYLLLEIDTQPLVEDRIQDKVLPLKKLLKKNNLSYSNFVIQKDKILFEMQSNNFKKFNILFNDKKNNLINPYISKYNSYELDLIYTNNQASISFSKFGLLTINNSALNQSIEIVRRRIDDTGTKEPTILQRGEKRILVELPGLKDPERIKQLLGKTAQLNFRLVSENNEFGAEKLLSELEK